MSRAVDAGEATVGCRETAGPRSRVLALIALSGLLLSTGSCRDAVAPFETRDRLPNEPGAAGLRLTYSAGDDRSPAWSRGSDSVYYSASRSDHLPLSDGVLTSIHRSGGESVALHRGQMGIVVPMRLVEPEPRHGDDRIAFVELRPLLPESACAASSADCVSMDTTSVRLTAAWLRIAASAEATSSAVMARFEFAGGATRVVDDQPGLPLFETRYHPVQAQWLRERALPVKPSWSPGGDAITIGDGSAVYIIDIATGERTVLTTGDVANPAWSPDGEWIAFDRVERVDSIFDVCLLIAESGPQCRERRTFYTVTEPELHLVRPDGSDPWVLGPGSDPAWDSSGEFLYYVDDASIRRRHLVSGADAAVSGTDAGREPSVSPDGNWLAFTRYDPSTGGNDVWVVALEP